MSDQNLIIIGTGLVIVGLIIGMVALILGFRKTDHGNAQTRGGAVLIVGPIPIVFGSDKESTRILLVLAIILVVVLLAFFLLQQLL